jgi:hypothetical protein
MDPCSDLPLPLVTEFFTRGLPPPIGRTIPEGLLEPVFAFLSEEYHRSRESLESRPFNVEDCLAHLDYLIESAGIIESERARLFDVRMRLLTFMLRVLSLQDTFHHPSDAIEGLAGECLRSRAVMISFNYDTILEQALERASGPSGYWPRRGSSGFREWIGDDALREGMTAWKRTLGYGYRFQDLVVPWMSQAGTTDGSHYYGIPGNQPYDTPLLKLHGSLNWFRYVEQRVEPGPNGPAPAFADRGRRVLLKSESYVQLGVFPLSHDGWVVEPIFVPPTGSKERYLSPILEELWVSARRALSDCRKLVSIGYSYGALDYQIRSELRHAFAARGLDELIVVNPTTAARDLLEELCQPRTTRHYASLEEYVDVECPCIRHTPFETREFFSDLGRRLGVVFPDLYDVLARCRVCSAGQPSSRIETNLSLEEAQARASIVERLVCPRRHEQVLGSADKSVYPATVQDLATWTTA